MRLTELRLENYGSYANRELVIPEGAGLTVVFGANEAGKSTCLEAISDFLFTIPKNTQRGSLFGYDGMRISASMRMADGAMLTLKRRKGNGRTLTDTAGTALDETVLAPVVGAITRDRFETLFGLNHETLRNGGERLLHAEGDIGRLIVEAGGGLRTLVARLEDIDAEAGKLFDTRRSASRTFYQQLSAFEAADKTARGAQLTRETYEQTRKAAGAAAAKLNGLRDERRSLVTDTGKLDRVLRVAPHLRELDALTDAIDAYDDVASFQAEFAETVRSASAKREAAGKHLESAIERRDRIKARLDAFIISEPLKSLEKRLRDLGERAIHVGKARSDRTNRQREIDEGEAQLADLRRILGLVADADLSSLIPDQAALDRVRSLADEAIERRPRLANARSRVDEFAEKLATLDNRLEAAREEGLDAPAETSSSVFASIAAQKSAVDAKQHTLDVAKAKLTERVTALDFNTFEALAEFCCPSAEDVRTEQTAREALAMQLEDQAKLKRQAQRDLAAGESDIAELQASGTIASDASVAEARAARADAWAPIRAAYVDGRISDEESERRHAADTFEAALSSADELADRRAEEAERAAALAQAQRRVADATIKLCAAQEEESALSRRIEARGAAWSQSFPNAEARYPTLASLLLFVQQRQQLLDDVDTHRSQSDALAVDLAQLGPTLELFERTEQRMGLDPALSFAVRVGALQTALSRHEQGHAEFVREQRDQEEAGKQLRAAKTELDRLNDEQAAWEANWPSATTALGLGVKISPAAASSAVTEWAGARGVLAGIKQTRHRLRRMDEDEASLGTDAAALAAELQIEVSEDSVVASQMLLARFDANATAEAQYGGLLPDFEETKVDVEIAQEAVAGAQGELGRLASIAGVDQTNEALIEAAARCDARSALTEDKKQAERTASDVGDKLDLASLRAEWGGRDLDDIRADLEDKKARAADVEAEIEVAILTEKTARDDLAAFLGESQVNRAVAEREAATAQMHLVLERYLELSVARELVVAAMATIRAEQTDPLVQRASALFAAITRSEFAGIETDIDDKGQPVVVGRRANGGIASVATMSDGTRDQLFLSFRLASLENYGAATEPLPFIADDILVQFDDDRSQSTLELLAEFAATNQVLLFTHHRSVRALAEPLSAKGFANIIDLDRAA